MLPLALITGALLTQSGGHARIEEQIATIRRDFKSVQSQLPKLEKRERMLRGISTEGASVTAYRDGGLVRKISMEALGEMGKYLADFYYNDGKLFFAFIRVIEYGGHIMETLEGKKLQSRVTDEDRLYFVEGELVRWLKFKKRIPTSHREFSSKKSSTLAEAESLLLLMKTPAPKKGEAGCEWACAQNQQTHCTQYVCR